MAHAVSDEDAPAFDEEDEEAYAAAMEPFRPALTEYLHEFRRAYNDGMRRKLGLGLDREVAGGPGLAGPSAPGPPNMQSLSPGLWP